MYALDVRGVVVSVYVDDAVHLWRGRRWAHLLADTLEELHRFADALGVPRRAFQDRRSGAHYDVDAALRERALALGAVAISRHADRERMRAIIRNAKRQWSGAARADGHASAHAKADRDAGPNACAMVESP